MLRGTYNSLHRQDSLTLGTAQGELLVQRQDMRLTALDAALMGGLAQRGDMASVPAV